VSVHNRILELAPDLARTLAQRGAWYFDRKVRVQLVVPKAQSRAYNRAFLLRQTSCYILHIATGGDRAPGPQRWLSMAAGRDPREEQR
jgi:hypothetical protein